jgi:hypothetical protein
MISTAYRAGDQETRDAFWSVVHSTNADGVAGQARGSANGAAPPAPANPNRSTKGQNAAGASSPRAPQATPKVAGASTDRSKDDARSHLPTARLYQPPGVPKAGVPYRVIKVEDGDTVWIEANGNTEYVRLLGVDAAELTFKPEHAALDAASNRYGPRDTVALANEQREFLRRLERQSPTCSSERRGGQLQSERNVACRLANGGHLGAAYSASPNGPVSRSSDASGCS